MDPCCRMYLLLIILKAYCIFSGLKSVDESVRLSVKYYDNNVVGTVSLLRKMMEYNISHFIFSSSATVYGSSENIPIIEGSKVGETTNPYCASKLMVE